MLLCTLQNLSIAEKNEIYILNNRLSKYSCQYSEKEKYKLQRKVHERRKKIIIIYIFIIILITLFRGKKKLLGRAQPVIPPNLYSVIEHNSLGSPGKEKVKDNCPGIDSKHDNVLTYCSNMI